MQPKIKIRNPIKTISLFLIFCDMTLIGLSWYLAHGVRYALRSTLLPKSVPIFFPQYLQVIWVPMILTFLVFRSLEIYRNKPLSLSSELLKIFQGLTVSLILLLAFFYLFRKYEFSRLITLFFWIFSLILLGFSRLIIRMFLPFFPRAKKTALVVGAGTLGRSFVARLKAHPRLKIQLLGFVDDLHKGEDILGTLADLQDLIDHHQPDYLYLALPFGEYSKFEQIQKSLSETMASVRLIPDFYTLPPLRGGLSDFAGFPMVHLTDSPLDDSLNCLFKRVFDLALSLLALLIFSPIFLLIGLAIKLSSRGPIFYKQERMGLDGRTFWMWKFRTMSVDAEKETGPVWAKSDDQRPFRVGSFLRRTSLDELPQFINVLLGQMSVVGPRPERPVFVEKFKGEFPRYMLRHKMKAGITGWAQIHGWRGDTCLQKRLEHDLYYIENWSIFLDCRIVFFTIFRGFVHQNAY